MVDDIDVTNTELWKYVDDTTIAENVAKNQASRIQDDVNGLVTKSGEDKFQLNEKKCTEMRVIEQVSCVESLRLNITSDLKWESPYIGNFTKSVEKTLLPQTIEESRSCNKGSGNLLHHMHSAHHGIHQPCLP